MSSFDLSFSKSVALGRRYDTDARSPLSQWSQSVAKRWFDVACVLCTTPVWLPILVITGLAVRVTSGGPVLFRQQRIGRSGRPFTILKFRTMPVANDNKDRPRVTTSVNQRFTRIGAFLRRWKLDELPQLINVLRGEMSLVGPRPKLACHQVAPLACRPGITGQATLLFAREEMALASVPSSRLESFYEDVILPAKRALDEEYMATATMRTDLLLLFKSVFRVEKGCGVTDLKGLPSVPFADQSNPIFASNERS